MGTFTCKGAATLVVGTIALVACAQGPADFIADTLPSASTTAAQPVRTVEGREALARDLDATAARQASEGLSAGGGLSSAMALSIIRQQQEEEARALLDASAPETPTPPSVETCVPGRDNCVAPAE